MLHPALQAFLTANADRFPDLTITPEDDRLSLEWGCDEIIAFMFSAESVDPSFECEDDTAVCEPDHFAAAVEAFAWRLLDADEFIDLLKTATDRSESEPGTFGALVWTKAIDLHIDDMESTIARLRAERGRLNPTTIADLPLFAATTDHGEE